MLIKHSKRTIRSGCSTCHRTDLWWGHDTDARDSVPLTCAECGSPASGGLVLMERDVSKHECVAARGARGLPCPAMHDDEDPPGIPAVVCLKPHDGWVCSRPKGHSGEHRAYESHDNRTPLIQAWPNEDKSSKTIPAGAAKPNEDKSSKTIPAGAAKPKSRKRTIESIRGYFPRIVEADTTDVSLLQKMRSSGLHVLLEGPPGTGKTALAMAAHEDLYTVVCSADTESADFLGQWTQRPDGTFAWSDGPAVRAAEAGAVLFVDECNLAPPSVLSSSLYPLMDGRGRLTIPANPDRGEVVAMPGFVVVGAANPNVPGGRFSEALLSRFTLHMTFETDWSIADSLDIPADFVRVARNLDVKRRNGEVDWTPQVRDAIAFRNIAATQSLDFAWRALVTSADEYSRQTVASVVSAVVGHEILPLTLGSSE